MMIGNIPFVTTAVVLIRRYLFRKKMGDIVKHSKTMHRLVQDIEDTRLQSHDCGTGGGTGLRHRPQGQHNHLGHGKQKRLNLPSKLSPLSRSRTYHYQKGFGFIPTPWETKLARNLFARIFDRLASELKPERHEYISFKPKLDSKGRFLELSEQDRMELGGVEYRALQTLLLLLLGYQLFWYT